MKTWTIPAALVALLITALAVSALANGHVMTSPPAPSAGVGPAVSPAAPPMVTAPAPTPAPAAEKTYTTDQLLTMTVAQAWDCSGQNYQVFVSMVRDLANLSMQKRGITIPDTKAAGNEIGCMIRQRAQADPNQLLYVVVDSSIRDYATAHKLPTNPAAACPF